MKTAEKQIIDLLTEVLKVAQTLVAQRDTVKTATPEVKPKRSMPVSALGVGIYTMQSKYNPYRAFQWDAALHANVSLGAFPSIAKAKQAQKDYLAGRPITCGTRAGKVVPAKLTLVKKAA